MSVATAHLSSVGRQPQQPAPPQPPAPPLTARPVASAVISGGSASAASCTAATAPLTSSTVHLIDGLNPNRGDYLAAFDRFRLAVGNMPNYVNVLRLTSQLLPTATQRTSLGPCDLTDMAPAPLSSATSSASVKPSPATGMTGNDVTQRPQPRSLPDVKVGLVGPTTAGPPAPSVVAESQQSGGATRPDVVEATGASAASNGKVTAVTSSSSSTAPTGIMPTAAGSAPSAAALLAMLNGRSAQSSATVVVSKPTAAAATTVVPRPVPPSSATGAAGTTAVVEVQAFPPMSVAMTASAHNAAASVTDMAGFSSLLASISVLPSNNGSGQTLLATLQTPNDRSWGISAGSVSSMDLLGGHVATGPLEESVSVPLTAMALALSSAAPPSGEAADYSVVQPLPVPPSAGRLLGHHGAERMIASGAAMSSQASNSTAGTTTNYGRAGGATSSLSMPSVSSLTSEPRSSPTNSSSSATHTPHDHERPSSAKSATPSLPPSTSSSHSSPKRPTSQPDVAVLSSQSQQQRLSATVPVDTASAAHRHLHHQEAPLSTPQKGGGSPSPMKAPSSTNTTTTTATVKHNAAAHTDDSSTPPSRGTQLVPEPPTTRKPHDVAVPSYRNLQYVTTASGVGPSNAPVVAATLPTASGTSVADTGVARSTPREAPSQPFVLPSTSRQGTSTPSASIGVIPAAADTTSPTPVVPHAPPNRAAGTPKEIHASALVFSGKPVPPAATSASASHGAQPSPPSTSSTRTPPGGHPLASVPRVGGSGGGSSPMVVADAASMSADDESPGLAGSYSRRSSTARMESSISYFDFGDFRMVLDTPPSSTAETMAPPSFTTPPTTAVNVAAGRSSQSSSTHSESGATGVHVLPMMETVTPFSSVEYHSGLSNPSGTMTSSNGAAIKGTNLLTRAGSGMVTPTSSSSMRRALPPTTLHSHRELEVDEFTFGDFKSTWRKAPSAVSVKTNTSSGALNKLAGPHSSGDYIAPFAAFQPNDSRRGGLSATDGGGDDDGQNRDDDGDGNRNDDDDDDDDDEDDDSALTFFSFGDYQAPTTSAASRSSGSGSVGRGGPSADAALAIAASARQSKQRGSFLVAVPTASTTTASSTTPSTTPETGGPLTPPTPPSQSIMALPPPSSFVSRKPDTKLEEAAFQWGDFVIHDETQRPPPQRGGGGEDLRQQVIPQGGAPQPTPLEGRSSSSQPPPQVNPSAAPAGTAAQKGGDPQLLRQPSSPPLAPAAVGYSSPGLVAAARAPQPPVLTAAITSEPPTPTPARVASTASSVSSSRRDDKLVEATAPLSTSVGATAVAPLVAPKPPPPPVTATSTSLPSLSATISSSPASVRPTSTTQQTPPLTSTTAPPTEVREPYKPSPTPYAAAKSVIRSLSLRLLGVGHPSRIRGIAFCDPAGTLFLSCAALDRAAKTIMVMRRAPENYMVTGDHLTAIEVVERPTILATAPSPPAAGREAEAPREKASMLLNVFSRKPVEVAPSSPRAPQLVGRRANPLDGGGNASEYGAGFHVRNTKALSSELLSRCLVKPSLYPPPIASLTQDGVYTVFRSQAPVQAVACSPDFKCVATGSADGTVSLFDIMGKKFNTLPHPQCVSSVSFSQNCKYVVTGCHDGRCRLWPVKRQSSGGGSSSSSGSTDKLSNSGQKVAAPLIFFDEHQGSLVTTLHFQPWGDRVMSGSSTGKICIWMAATSKLVFQVNHNTGILTSQFSVDGKVALTCDVNEVLVLDPVVGSVLLRLSPQTWVDKKGLTVALRRAQYKPPATPSTRATALATAASAAFPGQPCPAVLALRRKIDDLHNPKSSSNASAVGGLMIDASLRRKPIFTCASFGPGTLSDIVFISMTDGVTRACQLQNIGTLRPVDVSKELWAVRTPSPVAVLLPAPALALCMGDIAGNLYLVEHVLPCGPSSSHLSPTAGGAPSKTIGGGAANPSSPTAAASSPIASPL